MFCPVCGSLGIKSFLVSHDPAARYRVVAQGSAEGEAKRLVHCAACGVDFSAKINAVNAVDDERAQALVNYDFYRVQFEPEKLLIEVDLNAGIINAFDRFFRRRARYLEFGIGLGMLSRAAARTFETVVGLDLEVETARALGQIPDNVTFHEHNSYFASTSDDPDVDALAAWHVLEHLPKPHDVLPSLITRLGAGGVFFGQVPLLRPDYVIEAHYVFYDEASLIRLLSPYGLRPVYFERDEVNDFMSFCLRKDG